MALGLGVPKATRVVEGAVKVVQSKGWRWKGRSVKLMETPSSVPSGIISSHRWEAVRKARPSGKCGQRPQVLGSY